MTDYESRIAAAGFDLTQDFYSPDFVKPLMATFDLRRDLIKTHAFAILNSATVEALKPYGPMLEIGSGTGYWAMELRKAGIEVLATDREPGCQHYFDGKLWINDTLQIEASAAVREYPRRTLLVCWPSYQETWAFEALKDFSGEYVIHVGELGGCTANDEFYSLFESWEEEKTIDIPQWPGIHDYISIRKNPQYKEPPNRRRVQWR